MIDQVDPLGQATHYEYDDNGNVTEKTVTGSGAADVVTTYTYTEKFNQLASVKDAMGNETDYTYDANGNLLTTTDALGNTVTNHYDAHGQLTSMTDANGGTATYSYDAYGNLDRDEGCGRRYDHLHHTIQAAACSIQRIRSGIISSTPMIRLGRVLTMTADAGAGETMTTTYTYSAGGEVLTQTDGLGHTTAFTYDQAGRVISKVEENVKRADGSTEVFRRPDHDLQV